MAIWESNEWDIKILKALSHPTNRRIIECLAEEDLSFTQLLNRINGPCEHGKFGYHLRRLTEFVEFEPATKKYKLTYRGRLLLDIIREFHIRVQKGTYPLRYAEQLTAGAHAFAVFNSESLKHEIVFPFFKAGLSKGYAAVYLVGEEKLHSEVLALKKRGIDLDSLPTGAFTVMSSFDWYIQKGKAEGKTIKENLKRLLEEKKKVGFAGLWCATEMAVFLDNGKDKELLQYEESLGRQFGLDVAGICLFDNKRFAEMGISQLYKCHGHIISEEICGKTKVS
jgi:DNA-binding transcriptional ArsR family regulator